MAFCHSCGSGLVDGAAFCNSCGQRVMMPSGVSSVESRSSQINGGPGGVAVATAVAATPRAAIEQTFLKEGDVRM